MLFDGNFLDGAPAWEKIFHLCCPLTLCIDKDGVVRHASFHLFLGVSKVDRSHLLRTFGVRRNVAVVELVEIKLPHDGQINDCIAFSLAKLGSGKGSNQRIGTLNSYEFVEVSRVRKFVREHVDFVDIDRILIISVCDQFLDVVIDFDWDCVSLLSCLLHRCFHEEDLAFVTLSQVWMGKENPDGRT